MRKTFGLMVLAALSLVGCGGGDDDSFRPANGGGGTGSAAVSTVSVSSSAATIPADGSASSEITALVKDANNNAISGAAVTFSSNAGSLVVSQGTTDSSGLAKATLSASGASAGTSITVTANAGTVSGNTSVSVVNAQQTISVITSAPQIPSDGSQTATVTALVRGANNQFLEGVSVSFQASSGGIGPAQATTDENGAATATLSVAGDPTNRDITVTAGAGSAASTVPVEVTGTTLTFDGSSSVVQGSQSTYTARLLDSGGKPIIQRTVAFSSSNGNSLNRTTAQTDAQGQATVQMTATNSGTDTLTATALGLTAQQSVSVSNQNFAFTAPSASAAIALGAVQTVSITWIASGSPQVGQTVSFSTTRGTLSAPTAVTNGSGVASVTISSSISGPAVITASATGVTTQVGVNFVATTPATIAVQATPSAVPTQGQSTISAVVRDAQNNLVQGQTVVFDTINDITGGTLTQASATTDANGRAQTIYAASSTPSSSNGVTVRARVQSNLSIASTVNLTVGGQTVFLSLGTGNKISENGPKTQFIVPYTVQALDSSGNALNGTQVTLTIHSVQYGKGGWIVPSGGSQWVQTSTPVPPAVNQITVCANEDANLNGLREPGLGEDVAGQGNNNGTLEPGEIAAVSSSVVTTANGGSADFNVIYPQDHARWVQVRLTATTGVTGTESSTSAVFWLPILADYVNDTQTSPPGHTSPYGVATSCTNPN